MRRSGMIVAFVLAVAALSRACGAEGRERSWDECLKTPDRDCVLKGAIDEVYLLDRTDRRAAVIASIAQNWAKAGEIDRAAQLAVQVPDRLLVKISVIREIAAAQARGGRDNEAKAAFEAALQLAYGWKNALERGQALVSIAEAEAGAGMMASAEIAFDQALQAAEAVRIVGEKGRMVLPSPEMRLARLLQQLALHAAAASDLAQALQIARAISYDGALRVQTLLTLADLELRAGVAPEATFEEARAAARDPSSDMAQWPSIRRAIEGYAKVTGTFDSVRLLCDVARAQARAGLKASAGANLDEALQTIVGALAIAPSATALPTASYAALAEIADAQREAGLHNAARETLYRAAVAADAVTPDRARAAALARVAEVRSRMPEAAPDSFVRALAVAHAVPDDRDRAVALHSVAKAQADAGLREEASRSFAEAVGLAHQDGRMLRDIAGTQWRAGLIGEAAATFEQAIAVTMADERKLAIDVPELIRRVTTNDRGNELLVAFPMLGVRLLEAVQTVKEPLARAELLSGIARTLPN